MIGASRKFRKTTTTTTTKQPKDSQPKDDGDGNWIQGDERLLTTGGDQLTLTWQRKNKETAFSPLLLLVTFKSADSRNVMCYMLLLPPAGLCVRFGAAEVLLQSVSDIRELCFTHLTEFWKACTPSE